MEKKKILVVEDEIIIADNICYNLKDLGYEPLEPALNYTEAIRTIENEKIDIAILDIQISGSKTGIDIAREIKENHDFPFIFLTSNSDSATVKEAVRVMPSAFLVKPFSKEELYSAIELSLFNHSQIEKDNSKDDLVLKEVLLVKVGGVFKKIEFNNILYIKSDHIYIEIFLLENKKQIIRSNFNEILLKLNPYFVRVHRSYIVNTQYLEVIDKTFLKVKNELIPIGKKYRDELIQKFNKTNKSI